MTRRPYFHLSGEELRTLYESHRDDADVLKKLEDELRHRKRPKMRKLRREVQARLQELRAGATLPEPRAEPQPTPSYDDSATALPPDDRRRPDAFTLVNPPGVSGRPSKYVPPTQRDVVLDFPPGASSAQRFSVALDALVREMKRKGSGARQFALEHGCAIDLSGAGHGYAFDFIEDADLFEDARVQVAIGPRQCDATLVSITAGKIILSLDDDVGPSIRQCVLKIDSTALLVALKEKLDEVATGTLALNTKIADGTITNTPPVAGDVEPIHTEGFLDLNGHQQEAVLAALRNDRTFIWGPPGTGKTRTLTVLVRNLLEAKKRVLICSNTNSAVDQVLLKLADGLGTSHPALDEGRILRLGRLVHAELRDRYEDYVTVDGVVRRRSRDLQARKVILERERADLEQRASAIRASLDAFARLDEAGRQLEAATHAVASKEAAEKRVNNDLTEARARRTELERLLEERKTAGFLRRIFIGSEQYLRTGIAETNKKTRSLERRLEAIASEREQAAQRAEEARQEIASVRGTVAGVDRDPLPAQLEEVNGQIRPIDLELAEIKAALAELEKNVVAEAQVVGATVTRGYLSAKDLGAFDAVVIDEASMVLLPALYFVAGLATDRVVVSGDFRQLPPIVQSSEEAILGVLNQDVFHRAGVAKVVDARQDDPRVVMLDTQYRMVEPICDLVSKPMYDGRLTTAESRRAQADLTRPSEPYDGPLTVIDTSRLWPFESRNVLKSRFNLMHALLVRNLVWHLNQTGFVRGQSDLGVCTPYAAQAKLTRRILDDERLSGLVTASTVHRYQGDEKSMILIDIPESLGSGWNIGLFLQGDHPDDDGSRLLNVGVSRAQEHLIVLANLTYLDAKLPSRALLREILYRMQETGSVVDASEVLALRPVAADLEDYARRFNVDADLEQDCLFGQADFEAICTEDIRSAQKSVAIFSGFVTPQRVGAYGDLFRTKVADGIQIRCVTRPPQRNGSMDPAESKRALDALEGVGVIVDERWTSHEKVVLIDDELVWFGSLNPLSHTARTDEVMARVRSPGFALQLAAFLSIDPRSAREGAEGLAVKQENPRCPECESRTCYSRGRYGPYFRCESCSWRASQSAIGRERSRDLSGYQIPKATPRCPECGSDMVLRYGPFGPFFGCTTHPRCSATVNIRRKRR